ncbi:hypothetical protein [Chitinophaga sp. MM2321]|uniref:hypothetical protein n=1 Tax=Chitinophaga sp. MM2321 TaxID=3137178 RepID=UPI0032D5A31D
MKTLHLLSSLTVFAVMSCNQTGTQTNKNTDTIKTVSTNTNACYIKVTGKDSVSLHVNIQDTTVSGKLIYNYFEKDKNTGEINGSIHDGILRAAYQFMSEGTLSTRPVVFRISGNQAFEALTDSVNSEGIPVFNSDDKALKFDTTPLVEGECI